MQHFLINSREIIKTNQQQYHLTIRSNCPQGKVILCLHGGPGLPDAELVRYYNSDLAENATLVLWDQRGAGEAYSASFAFKKNLMKERVLDDINNLVNYLCRRFHQQKVILLAHDFGTVLSVWYVQQHPEKVDCLMQVNQVVEKNESSVLLPFKTIFPVLPSFLKERRISGLLKYAVGAKWSANTPLSKEQFDLRESVRSISVPVYLITVTKKLTAKEWFDGLEAPDKEYYTIESTDGNPMFEAPEQFNSIVKTIMGRQ